MDNKDGISSDMEEWELATIKRNEKFNQRVKKHLTKFLNGGIEKLVDKYFEEYYRNQLVIEESVEIDKQKYRQYLIEQIKIYIRYFFPDFTNLVPQGKKEMAHNR